MIAPINFIFIEPCFNTDVDVSCTYIRRAFEAMAVATIGHIFIHNHLLNKKMIWITIREWHDSETAYELIRDLNSHNRSSDLFEGFKCYVGDVQDLDHYEIDEHDEYNFITTYHIKFDTMDKEFDNYPIRTRTTTLDKNETEEQDQPDCLEISDITYEDWLENEMEWKRERDEEDKLEGFIMDANYWYETRIGKKQKMTTMENKKTKLECQYEIYLKTGNAFV